MQLWRLQTLTNYTFSTVTCEISNRPFQTQLAQVSELNSRTELTRGGIIEPPWYRSARYVLVHYIRWSAAPSLLFNSTTEFPTSTTSGNDTAEFIIKLPPGVTWATYLRSKHSRAVNNIPSLKEKTPGWTINSFESETGHTGSDTYR